MANRDRRACADLLVRVSSRDFIGIVWNVERWRRNVSGVQDDHELFGWLSRDVDLFGVLVTRDER